MALDSRSYRALPGSESTASTPSLRSSEPVLAMPQPQLRTDDAGNVKVVVRVRGFVKREQQRGAECLVRMDPVTQKTTLQAPSEDDPANARTNTRRILEEKSFTFDKSFWSHDRDDAHFAQQEDVYHSFGEEFLDHNFDGYHTCIFAYGQTGSGKSYTMMGTPEQPGLIPRTCEELFDRIQHEPSPNTNYHVHVSYFEVYNEHVRDLLVPRTNPPLYLKIRESQTEGVYVQGLTDQAVKCYADVERLMKMGDINRTTASTKMNDTSSRSHAVFTIQLKQIQHSLLSDETIERCARMRLVDLAGSERAKATEATGQRLKEGGQINKSLTTLGRVIAALADPRRVGGPGNHGRKPKDIVPYRDSVLTWLLKDSLGGNSKTAMVACISPSDYDETLSTLRYADQAKRIRTRATINQDSLSSAQRDAQIKEMAETIRSLQLSVNNATLRKREETTELEDYQKQVAKMQRLMEETREVSEAKIRALTYEVEEMRPLLVCLQSENDSLKRHLSLAVGELKNPIVLPLPAPPMPSVREVSRAFSSLDNPSPRVISFHSPDEDKENAAHHPHDAEDKNTNDIEDDDADSAVGLTSPPLPNLASPLGGDAFARPGSTELDEELQAVARELLGEVGLFRRRIGDDVSLLGSERGAGSRCPTRSSASRDGDMPLSEISAN